MNDMTIVEAAKKCDNCVVFTFADFDKGSFVDVTLQDLIGIIERQSREIVRLNTLANIGNMRANDYRVMRDRALKAEAEKASLKEDNQRLREENLKLRDDVFFGQRTCREWSETCDELSEKLEGAMVGQETLQKNFAEELERLEKDLKVSTECVRKAQADIIKKFWEELKKRKCGSRGIIPISCGDALVVKTINSIMCGKYNG